MVQMVAVPSRVFKQVSTWIVIATAAVDAGHTALALLADQHLVSGTTLALINVGLMFAATVAKLTQQNIALTPDQKETLIEAVANSPTKQAPPVLAPETQPPT